MDGDPLVLALTCYGGWSTSGIADHDLDMPSSSAEAGVSNADGDSMTYAVGGSLTVLLLAE